MAELGREVSRHPAPHPLQHILSPLSVRRVNVYSTAGICKVGVNGNHISMAFITPHLAELSRH